MVTPSNDTSCTLYEDDPYAIVIVNNYDYDYTPEKLEDDEWMRIGWYNPHKISLPKHKRRKRCINTKPRNKLPDNTRARSPPPVCPAWGRVIEKKLN